MFHLKELIFLLTKVNNTTQPTQLVILNCSNYVLFLRLFSLLKWNAHELYFSKVTIVFSTAEVFLGARFPPRCTKKPISLHCFNQFQHENYDISLPIRMTRHYFDCLTQKNENEHLLFWSHIQKNFEVVFQGNEIRWYLFNRNFLSN